MNENKKVKASEINENTNKIRRATSKSRNRLTLEEYEIGYSYPSSSNSILFDLNKGCYVVYTKKTAKAFEGKQAAIEYAKSTGLRASKLSIDVFKQ